MIKLEIEDREIHSGLLSFILQWVSIVWYSAYVIRLVHCSGSGSLAHANVVGLATLATSNVPFTSHWAWSSTSRCTRPLLDLRLLIFKRFHRKLKTFWTQQHLTQSLSPKEYSNYLLPLYLWIYILPVTSFPVNISILYS